MTSHEFLQEVLKSDFCPDNFERVYFEFQQYQQAAIDTLNEFHRVCEKNGIHYQLAYGSLLGAIRDKGQIPWDYDIDVLVPLWERDMLVESLRHDLDAKYYFFCPEENPKCRHNIMRLAPKGYNTHVLHVDVFYYTGSSADAVERKKHMEEMRSAALMRYNKLISCREVAAGRPKVFFSLLFRRKLPGQFHSMKQINKAFEDACWKYPHEGAKYYIHTDIHRIEYPAEYLDNTTLYRTAMGEYRIPRAYEAILTYRYKNYMELAPLEKRINEMMSHYCSLHYHCKHLLAPKE